MDIKIGLVGSESREEFAALAPMPQVMDDSDVIIYGAVCEGYAAGMAVYSIYRQSAELRWIYVAPEYRRKGVATKLVEAFSKQAAKAGIETVNLVYCQETIKGEEFPSFLEANGFVMLPSKGAYDIPLSQVLKVDNPKMQKIDVSHVKRMDTIDDKMALSLKKLLNEMAASGFMAKGNFIAKELSFVFVQDSVVTGCLLASQRGRKISIDLLLNNSKETNVLSLMMALAKEAKARMRDYDSVLFYAANPKVLQLAKYLFGDIESNGETYVYATALTM